jgi:hypothetical protein
VRLSATAVILKPPPVRMSTTWRSVISTASREPETVTSVGLLMVLRAETSVMPDVIISDNIPPAAEAPAAALYSLLRPVFAAPVAAASAASAAIGAALGTLIGFSASTRGYAYAWGISLWTALALIYELALTFTSIYFAVSEPLFAVALLECRP